MDQGLNPFQKARQAVQLESFMAWERRTNKRFPSGLRMEGCFKPTCDSGDRFRTSIRNGYFRCWSCGSSGDVVKAAALAWGMDQLAAARQLLVKQAAFAVKRVVASSAAGEFGDVVQNWAMTELTERMFEARMLDDAVRLSLNRRCVTNDVIDEALEHGLILGLSPDPSVAKAAIEDLVGTRLPRFAGLWREGLSVPACAFRPLWFRHGQGCMEVRAIPEGVKVSGTAFLRYGTAVAPFALPAKLPGLEPKVYCKSPLDAMSLRVLGRVGEIVALPGDSSWLKADLSSVSTHAWFAGVRQAQVVFSGQPDGKRKARSLITHLRSSGVPADLIELPHGLDVNDLLCSTAMV